MGIDDFDSVEMVFLDTRESSPPFDVLLWDQRTGAVHLLVHGVYTDADGQGYDDPYYEQTHESRLLIHAADTVKRPVPTVSEELERLALVIVRKDGSVENDRSAT